MYYILIHKKIKNIYLRVGLDGQLIITAPMRATTAQVQKLITLKQDWINRARAKLEIRKQSKLGLPPTDKIKAKALLTTRIQELSNKHNLPYNGLTLRTQKTRWGSCSSRKNISLNYNLTRLSPELIDYVILHELAHTKHMNHSQNFWDFLEVICPGAKSQHKVLKTKTQFSY